MPDLKLPRLPDRTSVKLTINAGPDLQRALADYAAIYNRPTAKSSRSWISSPICSPSFLRVIADSRRLLHRRACSPCRAAALSSLECP